MLAGNPGRDPDLAVNDSGASGQGVNAAGQPATPRVAKGERFLAARGPILGAHDHPHLRLAGLRHHHGVPDQFKRHILPEQIHILNVAFLVPDMRREFGGTAATSPTTSSCSARTAHHGDRRARLRPYAERLARLGSRRARAPVDDQFTAQAFITTDLDDNQITAFHPGAMSHAHLNRIADAPGATLGIVSPTGAGDDRARARLSPRRESLHLRSRPGLPMFSGPELLELWTAPRRSRSTTTKAAIVEQKTGMPWPSSRARSIAWSSPGARRARPS
jgi:hypothetical protein